MSNLETRILIQSIDFSDDKMYIELNSSIVLTVPYSYTTRLENATLDKIKNYRLIGNGVGIHFEDTDEDISVECIIRDFGNKK